MKYYYTDPLAAAWMAKNFGMVFIYIDRDYGEKISSDYLTFLGDWSGRGKILVHPDSLNLLEPQNNDIGQRSDGKYNFPYWYNKTYGKSWLCYDTPIDPILQIKIIRRNDIPFMWPESEE